MCNENDKKHGRDKIEYRSWNLSTKELKQVSRTIVRFYTHHGD